MERKTPPPTLHPSSHRSDHETPYRRRNREIIPSSLSPVCFDTTRPQNSQRPPQQTRPSGSSRGVPTDPCTQYPKETRSHPDPVGPNRRHPNLARANALPRTGNPSPSPERQSHGKMPMPLMTSPCNPDKVRPYPRKPG